jgi:nucleoid DNA-binding protein
LAEKKMVKITGLGSFSTYESRPRVARNPRDQTKIEVPAKTRIRFKATKALKETVQTKS